jgi:hypothetical protein
MRRLFKNAIKSDIPRGVKGQAMSCLRMVSLIAEPWRKRAAGIVMRRKSNGDR